MITTTTTQTLEEDKEALAAAEATAFNEAELTLQSLNHCLKEN